MFEVKGAQGTIDWKRSFRSVALVSHVVFGESRVPSKEDEGERERDEENLQRRNRGLGFGGSGERRAGGGATGA